MSDHVTELLALAAAGVLDPAEESRVEAHLATCAGCAAQVAEWRRLAEGLREQPEPRPSRALLARTVEGVERLLAERSERAWSQAALGFLVAFGWTLTVVSWLFLDLMTGDLAVRLGRSLGPTAAWYGAYMAAGWLTAGAAAVLLGRSERDEGRTV